MSLKVCLTDPNGASLVTSTTLPSSLLHSDLGWLQFPRHYYKTQCFIVVYHLPPSQSMHRNTFGGPPHPLLYVRQKIKRFTQFFLFTKCNTWIFTKKLSILNYKITPVYISLSIPPIHLTIHILTSLNKFICTVY